VTLSELRLRIWDALGKPTDLDPDTDTQDGGSPLLTYYVNEGQRQIALWKDPVTQRRVRIQSMLSSLNYRTVNLSDTVASANTTAFPYYVDLTSLDTTDGRYTDWYLVINNEIRKIVGYTGSSRRCYINDLFETDPEADDTVYLYKDFDYLLPSTHSWVGEHIQLPATTDSYKATGNLLEVLSIIDVTNNRTLSRGFKQENYSLNSNTYGDPLEWTRYGNKIMYDKPIDSDIWFKLEYYRSPMDISNDTDEPEIPAPYHYAIVLWGIYHGLMRNGEASAVQLAWDNLVNYMRSTYNQKEVESERIYAQGIIKNRWRY
jgi:hypothetical protein